MLHVVVHHVVVRHVVAHHVVVYHVPLLAGHVGVPVGGYRLDIFSL